VNGVLLWWVSRKGLKRFFDFVFEFELEFWQNIARKDVQVAISGSQLIKLGLVFIFKCGKIYHAAAQ
jgi:hypothetical protein